MVNFVGTDFLKRLNNDYGLDFIHYNNEYINDEVRYFNSSVRTKYKDEILTGKLAVKKSGNLTVELFFF